jgi:periplasmic copper chaperone A
MKQAQLIPIFFCLFLLTASQVLAGDVSVTDPWIREAPPGAKALSAYMKISNNSTEPVTLKSVSSPDFPMIRIHQTKMHEGMAHMQKQASLQIDPGESVTLEPNSYHLMLMHPVRSLQAGDEVKFQIQLSNGELLDVKAIVRKQ